MPVLEKWLSKKKRKFLYIKRIPMCNRPTKTKKSYDEIQLFILLQPPKPYFYKKLGYSDTTYHLYDETFLPHKSKKNFHLTKDFSSSHLKLPNKIIKHKRREGLPATEMTTLCIFIVTSHLLIIVAKH